MGWVGARREGVSCRTCEAYAHRGVGLVVGTHTHTARVYPIAFLKKHSPTESSQAPPSCPPTSTSSPGCMGVAGGAGAATSGAVAGVCSGSGGMDVTAGADGSGTADKAACIACSSCTPLGVLLVGAAAASCCGPEGDAAAGCGSATGDAAAVTCCCSMAEREGGPGGVAAPPAAAITPGDEPAPPPLLSAPNAACVCCWKAVNSDLRERSSRPSVTHAARSPAFSFCRSESACAGEASGWWEGRGRVEGNNGRVCLIALPCRRRRRRRRRLAFPPRAMFPSTTKLPFPLLSLTLPPAP